MRVEDRIVVLEDRADGLEARLRRLERGGADTCAAERIAVPPRPVRVSSPPPVAPRPAPPRPAPPRLALPAPRLDLDDLLGGRVLAWVGGVAVLVGVALLLGIALSRGWIDETARTLIAAAVSLAVLGVGVRQKERGRSGEAAFAATAAGLAGSFACCVVAGAVYDLVPVPVALAGALAVGALATALAIRWQAVGIGALGIAGALLSPVLVGAPLDGATMTMLVVATASATAVVAWQRWNWLAFATFAIVTPQWGGYVGHASSTAAILAVLVAFGALAAIAAIAFELRSGSPLLRAGSAVLLALNAIVLAAVGALVLGSQASDAVVDAWLTGLAVVHAAGGVLALRSRRASEELALTLLTLGALLGDIAFAALADGLPLVLGWAATAVGFAALARRAAPRSVRAGLAEAGLGGQLALALVHAMIDEAPASGIGHGGLTAVIALAAIAAACVVSSRRIASRDLARRAALEGLGMAVLAYLSATALDGLALALAWAGQAAALALAARPAALRALLAGGGTDDEVAPDPIAFAGATAFLVLATAWILADVAPPSAVVDGLAHPLAAIVALVALAGAALATARAGTAQWRPLFAAFVIAIAAYLPAVTLDGLALIAAWSAEAAVLGVVAHRLEALRVVAVAGAGSVLGLAAIDLLSTLAPPSALVDGLTQPVAAAPAFAAIAIAAWIVAGALPAVWRTRVRAAVALLALYGASVELVTPLPPQQGQALLSTAWALTGVIGLLVGLVRDLPALRRAALALLAVTVAKVFLYDLASLTSLSRVASFIGLGLLLLAAAFAWQRVRPGPVRDMRRVPAALR